LKKSKAVEITSQLQTSKHTVLRSHINYLQLMYAQCQGHCALWLVPHHTAW